MQDPDHAGQVKTDTLWERNSLLDAQQEGLLDGPLQRGPKQTDAVDGHGQTWDVKAFDSRFPGQGGFTLSDSLNSIGKELNDGNNVLVETRWMSAADVQTLQQAVSARPDWLGRVQFLVR